MIRTGEAQIGKLIVTDDVNENNVSIIKNTYKIADLYIDKRFDIPMRDYKYTKINNSKTYDYIEEQLREIEELVKSGKKTIVQGETPLMNFKLKINFWCNNVFKDIIHNLDDGKVVNIIIHNSVSKHEYQLIKWLNERGLNAIIITKDINKIGGLSDNTELNIYNTNENMNYIHKDIPVIADTSKVKSLSEIEDIIYDENKHIKIYVIGIGSYIDSCDFYGKLYITSTKSTKFKLFTGDFGIITQEEINRIPRFKKDNHDYIVTTLLMFVNATNKVREQKLKEAIKSEFNSDSNKSLTGSILYNKMLYTITNINKIVNSEVTHIVFYGEAGKNETSIIRVLSVLDDMSLIIITPNKEKVVPEIKEVIQVFEMESSIDMEMPQVDSRDNARTTGAVASRIANETLYNGDLLGMYKPGQFLTCETKLFSTAYEEIELWWNKELYNRPQFKAEGIKVQLPVMFKVINGVPETMNHAKYLYTTDLISKYLYGNTILCKNTIDLSKLWGGGQTRILRATDIGGTEFKDQKPFYSESSKKLDKHRIKTGKNYKYGFLNTQKQDFILSKIEEIINTEFIVYDNKQEYIDTVLNILLNLGNDIIKIIQWFEFYTDNPNLVLVMPNECMLKLEDIIIIMFMHLIGFDILIFVPTCFRSVDGLVTNKFQYEIHNIGYASYDMCTDYLKVEDTNKPKANNESNHKKKSLLSRLFG